MHVDGPQRAGRARRPRRAVRPARRSAVTLIWVSRGLLSGQAQRLDSSPSSPGLVSIVATHAHAQNLIGVIPRLCCCWRPPRRATRVPAPVTTRHGPATRARASSWAASSSSPTASSACSCSTRSSSPASVSSPRHATRCDRWRCSPEPRRPGDAPRSLAARVDPRRQLDRRAHRGRPADPHLHPAGAAHRAAGRRSTRSTSGVTRRSPRSRSAPTSRSSSAPTSSTFVAYVLVSGVAVALGDPVGPPARRADGDGRVPPLVRAQRLDSRRPPAHRRRRCEPGPAQRARRRSRSARKRSSTSTRGALDGPEHKSLRSALRRVEPCRLRRGRAADAHRRRDPRPTARRVRQLAGRRSPRTDVHRRPVRRGPPCATATVLAVRHRDTGRIVAFVDVLDQLSLASATST